MPFIETKTTKEITDDVKNRLTKQLGEAISIIKGKSERWLMLDFVGSSKMAFSGDSEKDCAIVSVALLGKAEKSEYDELTAKITEIISSELSVSPDRIYVKYTEHELWGFGGSNL